MSQSILNVYLESDLAARDREMWKTPCIGHGGRILHPAPGRHEKWSDKPLGLLRECRVEAGTYLYELGKRAGLHLSHHLSSMRLHGDLADFKLAAYLFVQHAGDYQRHDLPFARGERGVAILKHPHFRLLTERHATALNGIPDGAQQRVVTEWFGQELDRAGFHCLDRRRHITVTGDKDNRHVRPLGCNTLLQLKAIDARKRNVKYEAAWHERSWAGEEFLCGRKCLGLPTRGLD